MSVWGCVELLEACSLELESVKRMRSLRLFFFCFEIGLLSGVRGPFGEVRDLFEAADALNGFGGLTHHWGCWIKGEPNKEGPVGVGSGRKLAVGEGVVGTDVGGSP